MNARKTSLADMLAWMVEGAQMVGRHPGPLALATLVTIGSLLAIGLLMVLALLGVGGSVFPTTPGATPDISVLLKIYALVLPMILLLMPPLAGGWLRLCRDLDAGQARFGEFFVPFRRGGLWLRLVGCSALTFLVSCAIGAGVFALLFGGKTMDVAAMLTAGGAGAIGRLFLTELVVIYICYVVQIPFALAFADIAIGERGLGDALGRAFAAWRSNLLAIALFVLVGLVCLLVAAIIAGLSIALLVFLVGLLSPWLSALAVILFYLLLVWAMYSWMFATMYLAWRSLLGDEPARGPPEVMLHA